MKEKFIVDGEAKDEKRFLVNGIIHQGCARSEEDYFSNESAMFFLLCSCNKGFFTSFYCEQRGKFPRHSEKFI